MIVLKVLCLLVFLSFLSCSLFALCIDVDPPISVNQSCVHSCNRYKYEMPTFKEVEVSDYLSDVFRLNGFGGETVLTFDTRTFKFHRENSWNEKI